MAAEAVAGTATPTINSAVAAATIIPNFRTRVFLICVWDCLLMCSQMEKRLNSCHSVSALAARAEQDGAHENRQLRRHRPRPHLHITYYRAPYYCDLMGVDQRGVAGVEPA
ncbi:hypothetical protein, partial [Mycolicibacterium arseniciresistens]